MTSLATMTPTTYLLLAGAFLILAFLWTPLRSLVGGILSAFLTPAFLGLVRTVFLWLVWVSKKVFSAHWTLLTNLLKPRKVVYPSLEDDDARKL